MTSSFSADDIQNALRDGFYVTVGLGVIAFQKAQVQRQELRKRVDGNLDTARVAVGDRVKTVNERLDAVEARIDDVLDGVESQLPDQARSMMRQARSVAKDTRTQLTDLVESNVTPA